MSETASLPGYAAHSASELLTLAYSPNRGVLGVGEPHQAATLRPRAIPRQSSFIKQSKKGVISLQLVGQDEDHPVYGFGSLIEGSVNVDSSRVDNALSIELNVEGSLTLREVGGEGVQRTTLCLSRTVLWTKDGYPCPKFLPFSVVLPTTFSDQKDEYPLPPSFEVELPGVPGFTATIQYKIKAKMIKPKSNALTRALGLADHDVSTHFSYMPRTRPAHPIPPPLTSFPHTHGFAESPQWVCREGTLVNQRATGQDVTAKLYVPQSRIFSMTEPIPFHLTFSASALALASFMQFGPSVGGAGKSNTTIRIVRRTNCDIRNEVIHGTRTDIWRTEVISTGEFQRSGDGADWMSFNGRLVIDKLVNVGGFRAGGLFVRDFILLTTVPPEPHKAPFRDLRIIVPIRLTTDSWQDGGAEGYAPSNFSVPSDPDDYVEALPQLAREF